MLSHLCEADLEEEEVGDLSTLGEEGAVCLCGVMLPVGEKWRCSVIYTT